MGHVKCRNRLLGVHDVGPVLKRSVPGEPYYWLDGLVVREPMIFRDKDRYLLYYDACGPELKTCLPLMLAESDDLMNWRKLGPVQINSQYEYPSADYRMYSDFTGSGSPWIFEEDGRFYMYATASSGPAGTFAPLPYYTTLSTGPSLAGPWRKSTSQPGKSRHICLPIRPGTYYSDTACAGSVIVNPAWRGEGDRENKKYMMFFSSASYQGDKDKNPQNLARGVGIARTDNLLATDDYDKTEGNFWEPDGQPVIPLEDDVENATLFYEEMSGRWYMFVNHIHESNSYTDQIWVYWSDDANRWNAENKAVVMSAENCSWTKGAIGMPTVTRVSENRLAMVYDGTANSDTSHFDRDIALAFIDLPMKIEMG